MDDVEEEYLRRELHRWLKRVSESEGRRLFPIKCKPAVADWFRHEANDAGQRHGVFLEMLLAMWCTAKLKPTTPRVTHA